MPNDYQNKNNKNKSRRLNLSYGELTNRQTHTPKPRTGLSLAQFKSFTSPWRSVICRHLWQEYFTVYAALDDYRCKAVQANAVIVGSNASSDPCFPFFLHYLRGSTCLFPSPLSLVTLLFSHPSLFTALGKLSAFNEFHCHDSTARSDPYHHFDRNTRSRGLSGDPMLAPCSSATINYDEKPN